MDTQVIGEHGRRWLILLKWQSCLSDDKVAEVEKRQLLGAHSFRLTMSLIGSFHVLILLFELLPLLENYFDLINIIR